MIEVNQKMDQIQLQCGPDSPYLGSDCLYGPGGHGVWWCGVWRLGVGGQQLCKVANNCPKIFCSFPCRLDVWVIFTILPGPNDISLTLT